MDKPTPATVAAFDAAFPDDPRAVRRPMFGMAAGTVNGNFFAGVFEQGIALRIGEDRARALEAGHEGVGPFLPGGRKWPEYAWVAAERWSGTAELAGWVAEALAHTATLPPKPIKNPSAKPKARKPKPRTR